MNISKGSIIGIISNALLALSCGNLTNEQSPMKKYYHIADVSLSFSHVQKYFEHQDLISPWPSQSVALNFYPQGKLKLDITNENEKLLNQVANYYEIKTDSDWGKVLVIHKYKVDILNSPCRFCGITSDENFAYLKSHLAKNYLRDVSMKLEIGNYGYSENAKYGHNYQFLHDISYKTTPPDNDDKDSDKPKDKGIANFI